MWFTQDAIDSPDSIETFWWNNMPGPGHESVETGHLGHIFRVSYLWFFVLRSVVLGDWLGDYRNVIFSNSIVIVWCNNLPGEESKLVAMIHLDNMCWVLKNWWVRLPRLGFGCWLGYFRKSTISNIILWEGNLILMQHMVKNYDKLVKFRVKMFHFLISTILVGTNWSCHEEELVIQNWHLKDLKFCVWCCDNGIVLTIVAEEKKFV